MPNLRSIKFNPKGALGAAGKRMKSQSEQMKALGLEDPYAKKKKKKKKEKQSIFQKLFGD